MRAAGGKGQVNVVKLRICRNGRMVRKTKQEARSCHWNHILLNVIKDCFNISGQDLNQMNFFSGIVMQKKISLASDA